MKGQIPRKTQTTETDSKRNRKSEQIYNEKAELVLKHRPKIPNMRSPQLDDFTRESLPLLKSYPILHKLFHNTGEIASGWEEGGVGVTANVFFLG